MAGTTRHEVDDFNPRKQLDRLLDSYRNPVLNVEESKTDDSSVPTKVMDSNNTLGKAPTQVDEYVEKYTGADLNSTVVHDIE